MQNDQYDIIIFNIKNNTYLHMLILFMLNNIYKI
jgi:hypothetical protein